jgi:hypothetical protein
MDLQVETVSKADIVSIPQEAEEVALELLGLQLQARLAA